MNFLIHNMGKIKQFFTKKHSVIKHYLVSSLITFISAFLGAMVLLIDKINFQTIETGAWVGFIGVALRAGIKALIESWLKNKMITSE